MNRLDELDIENGVSGVHGGLVFSGLAYQSLFRSEGHEGGGCE